MIYQARFDFFWSSHNLKISYVNYVCFASLKSATYKECFESNQKDEIGKYLFVYKACSLDFWRFLP